MSQISVEITGGIEVTETLNDVTVDATTTPITVGVGTNGTNGLDGVSFGPPAYRSGGWYTLPTGNRATNASVTLNSAFAHPFVATATQTFTKLGIYVSQPSGIGQANLGVYTSDANGLPSTKIAEGVVSTASTGFQSVTGLTIPMTKNSIYWLVSNFVVTTTSLQTVTHSNSPLFAALDADAPTTTSYVVAYLGSSITSLPTTWTATSKATGCPTVWIGY